MISDVITEVYLSKKEIKELKMKSKNQIAEKSRLELVSLRLQEMIEKAKRPWREYLRASIEQQIYARPKHSDKCATVCMPVRLTSVKEAHI